MRVRVFARVHQCSEGCTVWFIYRDEDFFSVSLAHFWGGN